MTPEQRAMAARLASYSRWAGVADRRAEMAPARRGFEDRWLRLADPEKVLSAEARIAKADALKKAHFTRMALLSSLARSRKRKAA